MSATDTLSPTPSTTRTVMPLPHVDFLYLSEADMIAAGVTDMHQCVDTMEEMFALFAAGDYRMTGESNDSHGAMMTFPEASPFPNMPVPTEDRRFMAMPAYLGGDFQTTGVKWYGSNIANREKGLPRSILMFTLNDTDTGVPLAFMSANLLSAYRTGAVPGVGARHFARKDSRVAGIAGPGVMARTVLLAFMDACPLIDTLKIKGRGAESLARFQEWVREEFPTITTIEVVDSIEDVVRGERPGELLHHGHRCRRLGELPHDPAGVDLARGVLRDAVPVQHRRLAAGPRHHEGRRCVRVVRDLVRGVPEAVVRAHSDGRAEVDGSREGGGALP